MQPARGPQAPAPRVPASGQPTRLWPLTGPARPWGSPLRIHRGLSLRRGCASGARPAEPHWGWVPARQPHRLCPDTRSPVGSAPPPHLAFSSPQPGRQCASRRSPAPARLRVLGGPVTPPSSELGPLQDGPTGASFPLASRTPPCVPSCRSREDTNQADPFGDCRRAIRGAHPHPAGWPRGCVGDPAAHRTLVELPRGGSRRCNPPQ